MYYNTTNQTGKTLKKSWDKSKTQEDRIMDYFRHLKKNHDGVYTHATPDQVCLAFNDKYPITSIRRAMSDLTAQGKLRKTAIQKKGRHGRMNFCWTLNEAN